MTFTAGRNKWLSMWHIITTVKDTHGYSPLTYEIVRFTSSGFTLTLTSTMFLVILGGAKSVCTCRCANNGIPTYTKFNVCMSVHQCIQMHE